MASHLDRMKRYLGQVAVGTGLESMARAGLEVENLAKRKGLTEKQAETTRRAAQKVEIGQDLSPPEMFALEAIIIPDERPAIDISNGDFIADHPQWMHLSTDAELHRRICKTFPSIGRIELPGHPSLPYGGTGFVVGPDLLMTNRHVAEIFTSGLGLSNLQFKPGLGSGIDFLREVGSSASEFYKVADVVMIHPYWDMALLRVEGLSDVHPQLTLSLKAPDDLMGSEVAVIGYPAFDPRNDPTVQSKVFHDVYYVKRLQPGRIRPQTETVSFGKTVLATCHDSSTLGGNSGSAMIEMDTGNVVGLHFAGVYLDRNYGVPSSQLARDERITRAGVRFEGPVEPGTTDWDRWWEGHETAPETGHGSAGNSGATDGSGTAADRPRGQVASGNGNTWTIPLTVTVRVGEADGNQPLHSTATVEKMVEPAHDIDYANRKGYDPRFLGVDVPPPEPGDLALVATTGNGAHLIPYHNFSLAMHRKRRLALYTASNLDASPAARRPDPTRDYTRDGLGSLGPNDTELWFEDPRLPREHQLPDRFFTRDDGAFDKGHLVRREDVAWGSTYEAVRNANGDTFHVTNCSPQVRQFNRAARTNNWGDLENLVSRQSGTDRVSIFSGPVLSFDDPIFVGRGLGGVLRLQIPSCYWKVVVAVNGGKPVTFAFLLKQDLTNVPLEFAVDDAWRRHMIKIADLQELNPNVVFPRIVQKSDQSNTALGKSLRTSTAIEMIDLGAPSR